MHLAFPCDITHFQLLCVQLKLWKEKNFFLLMNICTFNLSKSLSYCGYFGFSESHWMNSFWLLVAVYKSLFPGCWYKCWCLQFWRRSGGWVIGYLELIICIFKVGGTCWNIKSGLWMRYGCKQITALHQGLKVNKLVVCTLWQVLIILARLVLSALLGVVSWANH